METPTKAVQDCLLDLPALTIVDFTEIIDNLIGKTQRVVTDKQIEEAFKTALANWQR